MFSNPDADCQEKIKFIECYLGKIKEFVFTSSKMAVDDANSITPKMRTDFVQLRRQLSRAQDEMTRIKKIFADLDWLQDYFKQLAEDPYQLSEEEILLARRHAIKYLYGRSSQNIKNLFGSFEVELDGFIQMRSGLMKKQK